MESDESLGNNCTVLVGESSQVTQSSKASSDNIVIIDDDDEDDQLPRCMDTDVFNADVSDIQ